jgi:hypothetical protein
MSRDLDKVLNSLLVEIEDVAMSSLSQVSPPSQWGELEALEGVSTLNLVQTEGGAPGDVIPTKNQVPTAAQTRMALSECRLALD